MGDSYRSTEIDILNADGTCGGGSPRLPGNGDDVNNRHCAAWEEVSEALNIIAACWEYHGWLKCDNSSNEDAPERLRILAQKCKMPKNRGK